jgi:hypothetical protein
MIPFLLAVWRRIDAVKAQGQEFLRTFCQLVESKISRKTTLRFVAAGMRRPIDAMLPHAEAVERTIRHLLGNLSPRKKMPAFVVVAGVVGLALLLLLLLEISVRSHFAEEASDAAIDAAPASSASVQNMQFDDRFAIQPSSSHSLQSVDQLSVTETTSSSEHAQTFGQRVQEPVVPVPRPRKAR